ncbi:MAG: asparagine synthase (glutamine-hydrolyzing) [Chloroflexota bacterium]
MPLTPQPAIMTRIRRANQPEQDNMPMCGICGAHHSDGQPISEQLLTAMTDTIVHRGPDGAGFYTDDQSSIGLGMRRLAIIDLAGSDQPLYNEDKSVAVVFNGEIYNYPTLRKSLSAEGHRFRTQGDGETIPHLYEQHGIDFPQYLHGQFAIALWDSNTNALYLVRDRYGQKPLYYYQDGKKIVFGSEIKALLAHPDVPCVSAFEDDPAMLAMYLSYGYIPAPETAFVGIRALLPSEMLRWQNQEIKTWRYWQPPTINNQHAPLTELPQAVEQVRDALKKATKERLIADVPLGAFLSGGLDSSLIVALMQQMTNQQVKTFSIGFSGDDSFDETAYAKQVAEQLGTDHTAFTVEPQAIDLLEKLVWHHDQPFADSSAIPTFLVSQLTRQHVTVALTGDGGDEQFAGYDRFYAASLVDKLGAVPKPIWGFTANVLNALPEGTGYYNVVKRARRFAQGAAQPLAAAYFDWVRVASAEQIATLTGSADTATAHFANTLPETSLAGILHSNQTTYLPDDLLIKADRCSMAASLEARAPFLDHQLGELVAQLPLNYKLNGSTSKFVLKEAARGLLPDSIIDRKKHGFGVPLGAWLREDSSFVRDTLLSDTANQRGLLNHDAIEMLISEHETSQRDHNRILWTLLTLEKWHQLFIS